MPIPCPLRREPGIRVAPRRIARTAAVNKLKLRRSARDEPKTRLWKGMEIFLPFAGSGLGLRLNCSALNFLHHNPRLSTALVCSSPAPPEPPNHSPDQPGGLSPPGTERETKSPLSLDFFTSPPKQAEQIFLGEPRSLESFDMEKTTLSPAHNGSACLFRRRFHRRPGGRRAKGGKSAKEARPAFFSAAFSP